MRENVNKVKEQALEKMTIKMEKPRTTVVRGFTFESAHFLPDYVGKCRNFHGHSYILDIGISGLVNETSGMVVDFGMIKRMVNPIIEELDHHLLNEVGYHHFPSDMPTAENMVMWMKTELELELYLFLLSADAKISQWQDIKLESIRLYETAHNYAEWRRQ